MLDMFQAQFQEYHIFFLKNEFENQADIKYRELKTLASSPTVHQNHAKVFIEML